MAEAKPSIAPYTPNAWPRSLAAKMVRNVASTCGAMAAAASPLNHAAGDQLGGRAGQPGAEAGRAE